MVDALACREILNLIFLSKKMPRIGICSKHQLILREPELDLLGTCAAINFVIQSMVRWP
jgi:hypothetical protein